MREERFLTDRPIELHCVTSCGDIAVTTVDAGEAAVAVSGPEKILDALRIEMADGRLTVAEPSYSFRDLVRCCDRELRVVVSLPHGSAVSLKTAATDATLDGTFSRVDSKTASGRLRVTGEVAGDVTATSASGDVHLPRVGGAVEINSASGEIRLESVDGSTSVTTMSGEVRIESLREGHASVQSASGDITLGVQGGCAIDLDATSASGDLSSEIPLGDAPAADGGPTLVIRASTASGDIRILRARTGAPLV